MAKILRNKEEWRKWFKYSTQEGKIKEREQRSKELIKTKINE